MSWNQAFLARFGLWDAVLVVAVSLQATAIAYLRQPRLKAFAYYLPIPFSLALLALGRPVDTTNALGLLLLNVYIHGVRLLHYRLRLPVVPAIALAAIAYTLIAWELAPIVPRTEAAFWLALAAGALLALALYRLLPPKDEPAHRTALPVYVKLPVVALVVSFVVAVKNQLGGFMTLFPMVGVVGAYEARRSLWALARGLPTWMLAMVPMLSALRLAQRHVALPAALALAWCAFLICLLPLTYRQWRAEAQTERQRAAISSWRLRG